MAVAHGADDLTRAHHAGQQRRIEAHMREDLLVVRLRRGRPPARTGDITAVGRALSREAFGEVVVRQAYRGGRADRLGLVLRQPGPLRDRERGARHAARALGPGLRAAQFLDQPAGLRRRAHVVPQQCRAHRVAVRVEGDEAVLLAADRDRRRLVCRVAALVQGLAQGVPPLPRITLAARPGGDGVGRLAARHHPSGRCVDHQGLGGLGGCVHTDDERTLGC
ncbi:hypothetical protein SAV14893_068630 [Streptomyces avermitilis]|uniref:Uncharacterized protein n=1 Tax=Streptomyces avermitilis TaxID=33903 RepID=A0A4D4M6E9_STRAX|nr:hypothetical protein SAV14893_068630 [Streptomyces avermitilis]